MSARDLSLIERRCVFSLRMLCAMISGMIGTMILVGPKLALVGSGPTDQVISFGGGMAGCFLFFLADEKLKVNTPWRAIVVTIVLSAALILAVSLVMVGAA